MMLKCTGTGIVLKADRMIGNRNKTHIFLIQICIKNE